MMEGGSHRTDYGNRMDRDHMDRNGVDRNGMDRDRMNHDRMDRDRMDQDGMDRDHMDRDRSTVLVHVHIKLLHQQLGVSMLLSSCCLRSLPD